MRVVRARKNNIHTRIGIGIGLESGLGLGVRICIGHSGALEMARVHASGFTL